MQVLIVHCHPEPGSFNAALTGDARETLERAGHSVDVADLYAEGFDPVERREHFDDRLDPSRFKPLDEQRHAVNHDRLAPQVVQDIERLKRADLVILQFPLWWHGPPAMLKGWFDRVFVYGGLYSGQRRFDRGPLSSRRALCSVTTGGPRETFSTYGRSGDITTFMWSLHCSLYYVGFDVLAPQIVYGVQGGGLSYEAEDDFQRRLEIARKEWRARLPALDDEAAIPFSGWQDWDDRGVLKERHPLRWRV
ncbi:NAD(P)H-dependent oxidoreductase [Kushneria aurantia]|uniref:NAD(P)H-dependent oxidoreductase n=1 Tax=Kushneria aurantia TaxID=504092 RepID=A0ABV6G642_9GAMM|nr:NAD(P)H-dependent oxidoreductase [Kushneria aurantia]